jgi:isopenicillin N synthase-like dioxygenase
MAIEAKAASPTSQCRLTKGHLGLLKSSIYSLHFSVQPQPFFTTTAATCVPTILSGLSDIASADLAALYKYQNLNFRLCDYLPATSAPFGANSCGVYTDYGTISVIFQDAQPGLEAEAPDHPDSWIPILGNATIVLCGWYTLILSGGRVRAVRHRVRRVPGVRKLSTVLFVAPDMEVDLKPLEADKGSRAVSEAIMEGKINVG